MERDTIGNLLFLSGLTALSLGCAQGSGNEPRPGPFVASVGDPDPSDTWTDPIDSTGADGTTSGGGESSGGEGGWPSEGETGQVSGGTTSGPPPGDGGPAQTSGPPPAGEESGDDYGSTGYDHPPAGGDPCPALAQLYASCNPEYIYDDEIDLCNQARADAQSISAGCGAAHAEYLACLSTLNCGTLLQPGVPLACAIQGAATELSCG